MLISIELAQWLQCKQTWAEKKNSRPKAAVIFSNKRRVYGIVTVQDVVGTITMSLV